MNFAAEASAVHRFFVGEALAAISGVTAEKSSPLKRLPQVP